MIYETLQIIFFIATHINKIVRIEMKVTLKKKPQNQVLQFQTTSDAS